MDSDKIPLEPSKAVLEFLLKKIDAIYLCPECKRHNNWYFSQLLKQQAHSMFREEQRNWGKMVSIAIPYGTALTSLIKSSHEDLESIYQLCSRKDCEGVKEIIENYVTRIARISEYYFQKSDTKKVFSVLRNKRLRSLLERISSEEQKFILEKSLA